MLKHWGFHGMKFGLKNILVNVFILFVPLVVISGIIYVEIVSNIANNSDNLITQFLRQEKEKVEIKIASIERLGLQATNNTVLKDFFDKDSLSPEEFITSVTQYLYPVSEWIAVNSDLVSRITYITDNSEITNTTNIVQMKEVRNEKWFTNIGENTKSYKCYWEGIHEQRSFLPYTRAKQGYMVYSSYFRMPVRDKNLTYIAMDVDPKGILGINDSGVAGKNWKIIAVDSYDDTVIGSSENDCEKMMFKSDDYKKAKADGEGYFKFKYDKNAYHAGLIKIDKLSTCLVVLVPDNELYRTLNKARQTFIIWMVIGFTSIIIIGYLSSLYAGYKVKLITKAVHKIQEGEFNINLPEKGNDELDYLARSVNTMASKINDLINKVYKSELAHKEAMLAALQAQINPHFMFNTIETFRMMLELKGDKEVSDALEVFGSVIRYNTYSIKRMVPLSDELKNVVDYIKIQNMLHNNRMQIWYNVQEGLDNCTIPSLTLQPVIENSIIHGFTNKWDKILEIGINAHKEGNDVIICITDNGCGIEPVYLDKLVSSLDSGSSDKGIGSAKSIGLLNINERIRLKYGSGYGISIANRSDKEGVIVLIRIPYNTSEIQ